MTYKIMLILLVELKLYEENRLQHSVPEILQRRSVFSMNLF